MAMQLAVIHVSNWPAYEAELVDEVHHTNTKPEQVVAASLRFDATIRNLVRQGWTEVARSAGRYTYGFQVEMMSAAGIMHHIWLDSPDTFEPKNVPATPGALPGAE